MILNNPLLPQVTARISGESGYFNGSGFDVLGRSDLAYRFDAQINYKFTRLNNIWNLKIRARPRFFGLDNRTSIVKYSADGQYWNISDRLNWGLSLSRDFYYYNNSTLDVNFDIFQLQGTLLWNYRPGNSLAVSLGYFYRDINSGAHNDLDALVMEIGSVHARNRYSRFSIGAYTERFFIKNERPVGADLNPLENSGWRAGPSISYEFQRHFLLHLQYRYLYHHSLVAADLNAEHWLRVLWGRLISKRWAMFFLIDFYYRHGQADREEVVYHTYTSLNTESSLYGKMEYQLNKQLNLFVKIEYSRDDVQFQGLSWTSRQVTVGAEFGK